MFCIALTILTCSSSFLLLRFYAFMLFFVIIKFVIVFIISLFAVTLRPSYTFNSTLRKIPPNFYNLLLSISVSSPILLTTLLFYYFTFHSYSYLPPTSLFIAAFLLPIAFSIHWYFCIFAVILIGSTLLILAHWPQTTFVLLSFLFILLVRSLILKSFIHIISLFFSTSYSFCLISIDISLAKLINRVLIIIFPVQFSPSIFGNFLEADVLHLTISFIFSKFLAPIFIEKASFPITIVKESIFYVKIEISHSLLPSSALKLL
mgnify:CR=1 FL=1